MGPVVYLNGRFLPQAEARLTLHDAGFVFGATATDLCRTFRHAPFRLADHLRRFRRSCSRAEIPQPVSDDDLAGLAHEIVGRNASLLGPDMQQYAGKRWGDLPGELRTKIVQDLSAKFGEDYARHIKLYFEQIADTRKK